MKTQEIKRQNQHKSTKKVQIAKQNLSQKTDKKHIVPPVYNEYDEIDILQEFFTHPNYLEDYLK